MKDTMHRKESYNIMNDDIDNDINIQIEIQDIPESPSFPKLFFLKNNSLSDEKETDSEYPHYSNSPSSVSSNSSGNSRKTTYKKLTYEEVAHSLQKNLKQDKLFSELDILITFIKGQKHIYSQSFYITQQKVHLTLPSMRYRHRLQSLNLQGISQIR